MAKSVMTGEALPREAVLEEEVVYTRRQLFAMKVKKFVWMPEFWLGTLSFALALGLWWFLYAFDFPRMRKFEGPWQLFREFTLPPRGVVTWNPEFESKYGYGIWSQQYYFDIVMSIWRVLQAFGWSLLGIPLGLLMGWSRTFRDIAFPPFELIRPVPPLAWITLSIMMFRTEEAPILFVCTIASFFVVTLNTLLGVDSIDQTYFRAARCLGSSEWQIFRHVIIPGAMPFIFTGMIIGLGVAWFSLVGGEIIAGTYGLGYRTYEMYTSVSVPPLLIAMVTIGFIGFLMGLVLRQIQRRVLVWKIEEKI